MLQDKNCEQGEFLLKVAAWKQKLFTNKRMGIYEFIKKKHCSKNEDKYSR